MKRLTTKARADIQEMTGEMGWRPTTTRELYDDFGLDYPDIVSGYEIHERGEDILVRWLDNNVGCSLHMDVNAWDSKDKSFHMHSVRVDFSGDL